MKIPKYIEQIAKEARKSGFNPVIGDHWLQEQKYLGWYRGSVNDFHYFKRNVNGKIKEYEILGLNMAKKVAEDWTGLLWNDKCNIVIDNPEAQERLNNVLAMNSFNVEFGNLLEKSFALGNGFIIAYMADGEVRLDFITLTNAMVTQFDGNRVTGIVTIDEFSEKENGDTKYFTHLTYHTLNDNQYTVEHYVYKSDMKGSLGKTNPEYITYVFNEEEANAMAFIDDNDNIRHAITYDTPRPFFAHIKPNITNNFDINSPLGISVFANSIDTLKSIDTKFNATEREVTQNKTRIMLNSEWLKVKAEDNEQTGQMQFIKYYDEHDDAIIGIPTQDSEKLMEFYQGEFRLEPLEMSLQKDIIRLGNEVGLGKNYYNFEQGSTYVNEQTVIHGNSQTWRNKVKHEMILSNALTDIAHAILYLEMVNNNISMMDLDELDMYVKFDDSIISDDESKYKKLFELAQAGFIPKWKVLEHEFGISEKEAKELTGENIETLEDLFNETGDETPDPL
jgi:A118 family predicted phage portal protein